MHMQQFTEGGEVTDTVSIWAKPEKIWENGGTVYTGKWNFVLETGLCFEEGAIEIDSQEVTLSCPAGINLIEKAIETLEKKKKDDLKNHLERQRGLDEQIRNLKQITYQFDPADKEGEEYDSSSV